MDVLELTPMRDWCGADSQPLLLAHGEGAYLFDADGRRYLDGNSSIWTNIHGHNHPRLNAALTAQLNQVAHTSFLGFTHRPAIELAECLLGLFPGGELTRVFYSDNGSTAIEVALRLALQYWSQNGQPRRDLIVAFDRAYHGDTLGAASMGGIPLFQRATHNVGYAVEQIGTLAELYMLPPETTARIAAVIIEPLIQGAAGMRLWPAGMLAELSQWCRQNDRFLILDEVMTGFGRTGRMFACQHEGVTPDFIALAKGLTGGYLPLAATLTSERVFEGFLGAPEEGRTFFYGHSYCGSQLGCAVALASLEVFEQEKTLAALPEKIAALSQELKQFEALPGVLGTRQLGLIAAIDLAPDARGKSRAAAVCLAARRHGLLTRPILNTLVFMPPLCVTPAQIRAGISALAQAAAEVATAT